MIVPDNTASIPRKGMVKNDVRMISTLLLQKTDDGTISSKPDLYQLISSVIIWYPVQTIQFLQHKQKI